MQYARPYKKRGHRKLSPSYICLPQRRIMARLLLIVVVLCFLQVFMERLGVVATRGKIIHVGLQGMFLSQFYMQLSSTTCMLRISPHISLIMMLHVKYIKGTGH